MGSRLPKVIKIIYCVRYDSVCTLPHFPNSCGNAARSTRNPQTGPVHKVCGETVLKFGAESSSNLLATSEKLVANMSLRQPEITAVERMWHI